MKMKKITVLAVDDHPLALAGIERMLKQAQDIQIIGQAENGMQAMKLMETLRPQVLLLDLRMPGIAAWEVEKWVREYYPETVTLVLSAHDRDYYLAQMLDAGVVGYLDKNVRGEDLLVAIRRAAAGENLFTEAQIIRAAVWRTEVGDKLESLTTSERSMLQLLVSGQTNPQLAEVLSISERTVVFHISNLMKKLAVNNRQEAASWAVKYLPELIGDIEE
jgi:DNA-binding NarL/FixJ family response regulator